MKTKTSLILTVAALALSGSALAEVKIALVAKSLGNGFFEAANVGAQQAAKELGDVKVIYTGPTTTTAEAQIDVLNGLIAQGVDAIAISANDPDAVVPVLKKAMQRGIKVVSWDSGVAPAGRQIHLNPSNNALIGETNVKLAADALQALNVEKGEVAVLSATPTSTNQNIWIEEMKKVLPQYPSVQLVTVAYGDDLSDKSGGSAEIISGPESHCLAVVGGDCCRRAGGEGPGQNRQSVCHRAGAAVGNGRRDQVRRQQKLRHLEPD